MAFLDRLRPGAETKTIGFHELSSGIYLVQTGIFTLNQFKTGFGLDASDDAQLNQLVSHFQGLPADGQVAFRNKLESLGVLWETGKITEQTFINNLGIT